MSKQPPRSTDWHPIDQSAAQALTKATETPGVICGFSTSDLPRSLRAIPDVRSYYVSGYVNPQTFYPGLTVGGEFLVARVDGATTKNYNYLFAQSNDGKTYFAGPYKGYGHHVNTGQRIEVNSLFNQTPFSTKGNQAP